MLIGIVVYAIVDSYKLTFTAAVFPTAMAVVTLLFLLFLLGGLTLGKIDNPANFDDEVESAHTREAGEASIWISIAWFAGLFVLASLVGFIIAIALFIPTFLIARTRLGIAASVFYGAACVGFMVFLGYMLTLDFPAGVLQQYVELPWPLR